MLSAFIRMYLRFCFTYISRLFSNFTIDIIIIISIINKIYITETIYIATVIIMIDIDWDMLDEYWVDQYEDDYGQFFSSAPHKHTSIPVTSFLETKIPLSSS